MTQEFGTHCHLSYVMHKDLTHSGRGSRHICLSIHMKRIKFTSSNLTFYILVLIIVKHHRKGLACLLRCYINILFIIIYYYQSTQVLSLSLIIKLKESHMYTCMVLYCIGKSSKKVMVLAQGAGTLAVLGSMQPEHKMLEITDTVLKSIITQFRSHICSCQLRGKSGTVQ